MADIISETSYAIINPVARIWESIVTNIPGLIGALVIIILGYIVGAIIGFVVRKALEKTKFEKWLENLFAKTGRSDVLGGIEYARLIAALLKWWVFIAFLIPAANLIQLEGLSAMLRAFALWAPHLLAGVIIVIVGLFLADWASDCVSKAKRFKGIRLLSPLVRAIVVIYFILIALGEIGLRVALAENTVLIIVAGITLALALALGISFGYAFREKAKKIIDDVSKRI